MDKTIYDRNYWKMIGLLRSKREAAGITQQELAKRLGVSQAFVSKTETCDRRLDIIELKEICKVLNISLVEFITEMEQL